jgi:glycyl-tRNA synthetase beta chain
MVRELTELQGTMGGIYAREEGQPEQVWKAIYYHYLPIGVEADAPPTKTQLGAAAITWAAVSLADKLDSVAGMLSVGERPTGSRDPLGLRRLGNGVLRTLADLTQLTGLVAAPTLQELLDKASEPFKPSGGWGTANVAAQVSFWLERYQYLLIQRGFDVRNVRAVVQDKAFGSLNPSHALKLLSEMTAFTSAPEFRELAIAFKRVKNLGKELDTERYLRLDFSGPDPRQVLSHPSEVALLEQIEIRRPAIATAVASGDGYRRALTEASGLKPYVDRFFDEVRVKTDDHGLTEARLWLLRKLADLILELADISEIVET